MSYSKNHICRFMQVNSWHHKLFHFHLSLWIWKVWKGREKITKNWISREQKELFRWNRKHFIVFKGLSFGEKINIWYKIADTSFKYSQTCLNDHLHKMITSWRWSVLSLPKLFPIQSFLYKMTTYPTWPSICHFNCTPNE